jgi:hypothetical protein
MTFPLDPCICVYACYLSKRASVEHVRLIVCQRLLACVPARSCKPACRLPARACWHPCGFVPPVAYLTACMPPCLRASVAIFMPAGSLCAYVHGVHVGLYVRCGYTVCPLAVCNVHAYARPHTPTKIITTHHFSSSIIYIKNNSRIKRVI